MTTTVMPVWMIKEMLAREFAAEMAKALDIEIMEGYRSKEEQKAIYDKGREILEDVIF